MVNALVDVAQASERTTDAVGVANAWTQGGLVGAGAWRLGGELSKDSTSRDLDRFAAGVGRNAKNVERIVNQAMRRHGVEG